MALQERWFTDYEPSQRWPHGNCGTVTIVAVP